MRKHTSRAQHLSSQICIATALTGMLVVSIATASQAASSTVTISKTADRVSISSGEVAGFTVAVINPGSIAATNVNLSDPLPTDASTSWSIDSQSGSACSISNGSMTCPIGTLGAGARYSVHLTSTTTSDTVASSPIDNTATVSYSKGGRAAASASIQILAAQKIATTTQASSIGPIITHSVFFCGNIIFNSDCYKYTFTLTAGVVGANGQVVNEGTVVFGYCTAAVRNGSASCTYTSTGSPQSGGTATYSGSATYETSSDSF